MIDERKDTLTEISVSDFCEVINGLNERDRMNFLAIYIATYPTSQSVREGRNERASEYVSYRDHIGVRNVQHRFDRRADSAAQGLQTLIKGESMFVWKHLTDEAKDLGIEVNNG